MFMCVPLQVLTKVCVCVLFQIVCLCDVLHEMLRATMNMITMYNDNNEARALLNGSSTHLCPSLSWLDTSTNQKSEELPRGVVGEAHA